MDIITLGIGPGSSIEDLVLTGLAVDDTPSPTPSEPSSLTPGTVIILAEGLTYALPPQLVEITVILTTGSIEVSLDRTTWQSITLDSNKNFITSAIFIRSIVSDSTIIAKALQS